MVNTTSDAEDCEANNLRPEAHLLCSLTTEERIAWQAQLLQTTAELMAKLQEIVSVQASLLKSNNGVAIINRQDNPSTPCLPPFHMGKLLAMQHQVLEGVAQENHQCEEKGQIGSLKGPVKWQVAEAWKSLNSKGISDKPLGIQEPCYCCRYYGFPCLQNNSSKLEAKINQNHHPDVDKKRKAISQEPQLESSQHLSLTPLSVLVQCSSQDGSNPKESEVPQVRGNPQEICLDGWSITCKEFQPRKGKYAKKQTSEISEVKANSQNQQASDSLLPHGTSLKAAQSHQGSTPGKASGKTCFCCQEEGHFVVNCPKMYEARHNLVTHGASLKGAQSHQGSTPGKAAGKVCFHCQEEGHFVAHCPKMYQLLFGNRDAPKQNSSLSSGENCNRTPVQVLQSSCIKGSSFICDDMCYSINQSPKVRKSRKLKKTSMKIKKPKKLVKKLCYHCREKGHFSYWCPQNNAHLLDGSSQNQIPIEPPVVSDNGAQGQGSQVHQQNHTGNQANLEVVKEDMNTQSAI